YLLMLFQSPLLAPHTRGQRQRHSAPEAPYGPACRWASAAARPAQHTPPAPCTPAALPRDSGAILRLPVRAWRFQMFRPMTPIAPHTPCSTPPAFSPRRRPRAPAPPLPGSPDVATAGPRFLPTRSGTLAA